MAKKKSSNTEAPGPGAQTTDQPAESAGSADPGQSQKVRAKRRSGRKTKAHRTVKGAGTAKKPKKARKAVRYSAKQKVAVVQFVRDFDKANRRGGQSAAAKKFGVSSLTVSKWLKDGGRKKDSAGVAKKSGARPTRIGGSGTIAALRRMLSVREEIETLKAEFDRLKKSL